MSEESKLGFLDGVEDGESNIRRQEGSSISGYVAGLEIGKRKRAADLVTDGLHKDYIIGFDDGVRDAKNDGIAKIPAGNAMYNSGYLDGFYSVMPKPPPSTRELDNIMNSAPNQDISDMYKKFKGDGKRPKHGGKSKRRKPKTKKNKTKKRNQKK
jgi:hypothetical protein|uniref:Uncharacterized protein n=1 Tax=viral metagenome TaxID=1070528 RepID=A0A6C0F1I3_9ZZZZ